jgi:dTDP-4-amino-4,6-dideoxygalactose transaminase
LYKEFKSEIDKALQTVFERGAFISREELENFQKAVANFVGVRFAIGV